MLYLIKGRAGSGKSDFINKKIKEILDKNSSNVLLIVPEQFSFESERKMLKFLGEEKYNKIDIFSFPRLAFSVLNDSFDYTNIPSAGVRLALMHEAIIGLEGKLNIFGKTKPTVNSLMPLVDFSRELKYCSIKSDELKEKTSMLSNEFLKEKLSEINLINEAYDALLKQSYFDDTDALDHMDDYAIENKFFANKTIFIDGFRAFTKQEIAVFKTMLSQADDVYVTLCIDSPCRRDSSFTYIKRFEDKLIGVAGNDYKIEICNQNDDAFSGDILSLERGLFNSKNCTPVTTDGSVKVVECYNSDDECEYISKEIKRLLRSGNYRCRDIAVIERTAGTYKSKLVDKLRKLDIPVFDDSRRSLKYEPLFVYINSILKCISAGFSQESVFAYLKSGLSGVSVEDVSRLEKYAIIWSISGSKWSSDFTMHPRGYGNDFEKKDEQLLAQINEVRGRAVAPLLKLKKDCKDKTGIEIATLIYNFLESSKIPDRLYAMYKALESEGFSVEANRHSVSWDILISLLDTMSKIYNEKTVSISAWVEKFNLLVDSCDVGEIPQGLDEVKIGSADRIRTEKIKAVFLVGVNKTEFPLVSVKNGVLTDYDRASLSSVGLEINPPFEQSIDEERFIAYCAVTAASEKLYLVYKNVTDDGVEVYPSEIINDAKACISKVCHIKANGLDIIDFIESDEDAFNLLAKNYQSDNSVKLTLLDYFSNKPEYADKINALNRMVDKKGYSFESGDVATQLFGEDIKASPSSIETFFSCPFSYFMKYGLKARDVDLAEIDKRISGSIVHYVLECAIKEYFPVEKEVDDDGNVHEIVSSDKFINATDKELRACIKKHLDKYLVEKMGNPTEVSKRFQYLYNRASFICMAVFERLKVEFTIGDFKPRDFELQIKEKPETTGAESAAWDDETAIPAYELPLDHGKVVITGKIDRVDTCDKFDKLTGKTIKMIRVIDYKTGSKEFKLAQLFSGYNLQMVLYLIALIKNGQNHFKSNDLLPAAVLYIPSKIGKSDSYIKKRNPLAEEINNAKLNAGKLNGIAMKKHDVYEAMGVFEKESYFPLKFKKDDKTNETILMGDNYTEEQFDALSTMINELITGMGNRLHNGEIVARPLCDGESINEPNIDINPCKFCDYKFACGFEDGDEIEPVSKESHSDVLTRLGGVVDGD